MALTTTQRLQIKRHLGEHPEATILDPLIAKIEDGAAMEAELVTALAVAVAAETAIEDTEDEADEIVEGGGAKFSYERRASMKERRYRRAVCDLARIIGFPVPFEQGVTGFFRI